MDKTQHQSCQYIPQIISLHNTLACSCNCPDALIRVACIPNLKLGSITHWSRYWNLLFAIYGCTRIPSINLPFLPSALEGTLSFLKTFPMEEVTFVPIYLYLPTLLAYHALIWQPLYRNPISQPLYDFLSMAYHSPTSLIQFYSVFICSVYFLQKASPEVLLSKSVNQPLAAHRKSLRLFTGSIKSDLICP